jgi:hypothetical protein
MKISYTVRDEEYRRVRDKKTHRIRIADAERIPEPEVFIGRGKNNWVWRNKPNQPLIGNVAPNANGGRERT